MGGGRHCRGGRPEEGQDPNVLRGLPLLLGTAGAGREGGATALLHTVEEGDSDRVRCGVSATKWRLLDLF